MIYFSYLYFLVFGFLIDTTIRSLAASWAMVAISSALAVILLGLGTYCRTVDKTIVNPRPAIIASVNAALIGVNIVGAVQLNTWSITAVMACGLACFLHHELSRSK